MKDKQDVRREKDSTGAPEPGDGLGGRRPRQGTSLAEGQGRAGGRQCQIRAEERLRTFGKATESHRRSGEVCLVLFCFERRIRSLEWFLKWTAVVCSSVCGRTTLVARTGWAGTGEGAGVSELVPFSASACVVGWRWMRETGLMGV